MARLHISDVQIVLLEMQPPIVAASRTVPAVQLKRIATLVREVAAAAGVSMIASVVRLGEHSPDLIPELAGIEPLVRSTVSPFDDATILSRLRSSGRKVLAIAGVSSEIAILHTVLDATRLGYEVHVLTDMCGGLDLRTEQAAFVRMWSTGALPSSVTSFATSLIDDMATTVGRSIMQALDRYWQWGAHGGNDTDKSQLVIDQAITLLFQEICTAWREGDAKRFARPFMDDARFVTFDGSVLIGPKQISAYHETPFATNLAETELRFGPLNVRPIDSSVYIVDSTGGISRGGNMDGELIGASTQTFLLKLENDGHMRIAAFQNTRVRPIDGPAAAGVWRQFDRAWQKLSRNLPSGANEQPS
jgi:uncharacterized protein (TIGR02246 family)